VEEGKPLGVVYSGPNNEIVGKLKEWEDRDSREAAEKIQGQGMDHSVAKI